MRHRALLGALAGATLTLLLGSLPQTSQAYVLEGPTWQSGSTVDFQLGLGNAGRTLIDGNTSWNTAAAPALNQWDQNIQSAQLSWRDATTAVSAGDGINSIIFATTIFGQTFGPNTLAVTYYRYSGSRILEADILFNQNLNFDSYRGPLRYGSNGYAIGDVRRVLLHELGHALGLGHPDQAGQQVEAIMNSVTSNRENLSSDDIAGGQSLYGAPGSSPPPTPSPTPTPDPTPSPTPTATPTPTPALTITVFPTRLKKGESATYTFTASVMNPNAALTIPFTMSGTAVLGVNYLLSGMPGQVTIPAGGNSATVTITALTGRRRSKTAVMRPTSGVGYTVLPPTSATVSITK